MADPSFRSFAVRAHTTENPHLAQKPAGLAAGDLLVIFVNTYYGVASGAPSGFTLVHGSGSLANIYTRVYAKTATADDAAAASFAVANAESRWVASGSYAIAGGGVVGFAGSVNAAGNYLRQFAVDSYTPPGDAVVLWDAVGEANYLSYFTVNADGTNYSTTPYGRSDSGADWKNNAYLPTTFLHATWAPSDGAVTLAGGRAPNSSGNWNICALMVAAAPAAAGRPFTADLCGGLEDYLTGGI